MVITSQIAFTLAWTIVLVVFFECRLIRRSRQLTELCESQQTKRTESETSGLFEPGVEASTNLPPKDGNGDFMQPSVAPGQHDLETPPKFHDEGRSEPTLVRRLGSQFYSNGANGAKCTSITADGSFDMSSSTCHSSTTCGLCFMATGLSSAVTLEIVKCSTSQFSSTTFLSDEVLHGKMGTIHTAELLFINNDASRMMTIKAVTTASGTAHTTFYLPPQQSVTATCYGGGSNYLYFPSDIIDGVGTSTVNTYTFSGKTITDLGTVTTAAISGGSLDGATVGATTASTGAFTTLSASSTFSVSTGDNDSPSCSGSTTLTLNEQSGRILSCTSDLASGSTDTITLTNSYAKTNSKILALTQGCTTGKISVISAVPGSGSIAFVTMNHGTSACASTYRIMYLVL